MTKVVVTGFNQFSKRAVFCRDKECDSEILTIKDGYKNEFTNTGLEEAAKLFKVALKKGATTINTRVLEEIIE